MDSRSRADRPRLTSIDAFRGIAIALMILVNNPGDWSAVPPPLAHAPWDGCTLADLVFPAFLFIMGVAMSVAFERRGRGASARLWIRALTLVALGLVLNAVAAWPDVERMRVPGVLQRIGLAYLAAALLVRHTRARVQLATAAALLLLHWTILVWVPFDGWPAGTLTPAHNIAGYLDRSMLGVHILKPEGDPEGVLGLVSSVATVLLGALAGRGLIGDRSERTRFFGLAAGGLACAAAGYAWSFVLPLNKPLWTGSYALFASGIAALAFAACVALVDGRRVRGLFVPFIWLGANPLAIYFLSELAGRLIERPLLPGANGFAGVKELIYWDALVPLLGGHAGVTSSLAFALLYALVWIGAAHLLYRRGIHVRL